MAPRRQQSVDLAHYVPTVVSSFVDKLRTSSVAFLRDNYRITPLEWRVLSFLAARRESPSAYQIWNEINSDKAAISRTLKSLTKKSFVRVREVSGARRRTKVELTVQGRRVQSSTVGVIMARQRRLLSDVSDAEVDFFLGIIRRLEANIPKMDEALNRQGVGQ